MLRLRPRKIPSCTVRSLGKFHISTTRAPSVDSGIGARQYREHLDLQDLEAGLIDTRHLPHSSRLLPKSDHFYAEAEPTRNAKRRDSVALPLQRFVTLILSGDVEQAWAKFLDISAEDPQLLRDLSYQHCSRFLALLAAGPIRSRVHWPRAKQFSWSTLQAGHRLTAASYVSLLECAFNAQDYEGVESLWQEASKDELVIMDTELWNRYMMATCNAQPKYWRRWANSEPSVKKVQLFDAERAPRATNSALELLAQMLDRGVKPNSRSYELVLLFLAQAGHVEATKAIVKSVWGVGTSGESAEEHSTVPRDSVLFPQISTLTSTVVGLAFNDRFMEGMLLMNEMQTKYNIKISNSAAYHMWGSVLRWAFLTSEPFGSTPPGAFNEAWGIMTEIYGLKPNNAMYRLKGKLLNSRQQYSELAELANEVLASGDAHAAETARLFVKKSAKGYLRHGELEEARRLLDKWAAVGEPFVTVRRELLQYMNASVSVNQRIQEKKRELWLRLAEEGDEAEDMGDLGDGLEAQPTN